MPDIVFPSGPPPKHKKTANGNAVCIKCADDFTSGTQIWYYDATNQVYVTLTQNQSIPMEDQTTITVNVYEGKFYIA